MIHIEDNGGECSFQPYNIRVVYYCLNEQSPKEKREWLVHVEYSDAEYITFRFSSKEKAREIQRSIVSHIEVIEIPRFVTKEGK